MLPPAGSVQPTRNREGRMMTGVAQKGWRWEVHTHSEAYVYLGVRTWQMTGLDSEDVYCHFLTWLRNSPSDLNVRQSPRPRVFTVFHFTPPQLLFKNWEPTITNKELTISKKDIYIFTDILWLQWIFPIRSEGIKICSRIVGNKHAQVASKMVSGGPVWLLMEPISHACYRSRQRVSKKLLLLTPSYEEVTEMKEDEFFLTVWSADFCDIEKQCPRPADMW